MANSRGNEQASYIYIGLAGETGRGRVVHSGLYRMGEGDDEWEPLQRGLPDMPAVGPWQCTRKTPKLSTLEPNPGPIAAPTAASIGKRWTCRITGCRYGRSCSTRTIPT